MMSETLNIIWIMVVGFLLGTFFFGGLWFTVKKTSISRSPALVVFVSFIIRIAIVLVGFYFIGSGNWRSLGLAFGGFMIARFIVMWFTKPKEPKVWKREASHEH